MRLFALPREGRTCFGVLRLGCRDEMHIWTPSPKPQKLKRKVFKTCDLFCKIFETKDLSIKVFKTLDLDQFSCNESQAEKPGSEPVPALSSFVHYTPPVKGWMS